MADYSAALGTWRAKCGHQFSNHGAAAAHEAQPCVGVAVRRRPTVAFDSSNPATWPRRGETAVWRVINNMGMRLVERTLDRDWKDMPSYSQPPEYTFRK